MNRDVQNIAVQTMDYIKNHIYAGQSLLEIRKSCELKMLELGADSFWYYNIGALIFAGKDTTVSVSGRKYKTADYTIQKNDIITIDLSPQVKHIWGDYARTIVIENGSVVNNVNDIKNEGWKNGLIMEEQLHNKLFDIAAPDSTFEDIYYQMNDYITKCGYKNLDFNGNLGHSIERHKIKRVYLEKGNKRKLSSSKFFTFEPHISAAGGNYGFKLENIYYFSNNELKCL
ncbi:MAG: aminopeptidase P family protein [Clostridium sp.]|nr:aminopeptidase P family protein [Clostridium sp.]